MSSVSNVPSDLAVSNLTFKGTLTECNGRIRSRILNSCDLTSVDANITNLTVENITINNNITIPRSIATMVFNAAGTTAGDQNINPNPQDDRSTTFNPSGSAVKVQFTPSAVTGSGLSASGNDITVLQTDHYHIQYSLVLRTFSGPPAFTTANPLGTYGTLRGGVTAATVMAMIVIDNNFTSSPLTVYGQDSCDFSVPGDPVLKGSLSFALGAGSVVSIYVYLRTNAGGLADEGVHVAQGVLFVSSS